MDEPRLPRIAGRLETTRDRLERTKAMLQRSGDDPELEEIVTDALACADAGLARARGDDDALQELKTDGGSPELAGEDRLDGLTGNFYVELDGVEVEKLVEDISLELSIVDGAAALSILRDAGAEGYVGVLGRLPPEKARGLADALNEIADLSEKPDIRTDGGRPPRDIPSEIANDKRDSLRQAEALEEIARHLARIADAMEDSE